MKQISLILLLSFQCFWTHGQNLGINTTDPQVSLDVNGAVAHRSVIIDPFMNNVNVPVDASFIIISNVDVTGPVTILAPEYIDGKRLIIYNNSGFTATFNYMVAIQNGETKEFIGMNPGGYKLLTQPSQLEKITEGGNTGWRILGEDPANYGDIGVDAVDLSNHLSASSTKGATGNYSTAMGISTEASGDYGATALGYFTTASGDYGATAAGYTSIASGSAGATAIGRATVASGEFGATALGHFTTASGNSGATALGYSTIASGDYGATALGYFTTARSFASLALGGFNDTIAGSDKSTWVATDPLLTLGNGTSNAARSNAMTIFKNGTFTLQNHTSTPANSTDKFYILNSQPYFGIQKLQSSQLEKISEPGYSQLNTGWRLLGQSSLNYGGIGHGAVDLSISDSNSTTRGATGDYSIASGLNTTASSSGSIALGYYTTASGIEGATALGIYTKANGYGGATAFGFATLASGDYGAAALGNYTTASGSAGAIAMGNYTIAKGDNSAAMGSHTKANADGSAAMGYNTIANSFSSLVAGRYNDTITGSNLESWIDIDPLLTLGNGTSNAARSNALTVYKNGNTDLNGYVRLGKITDDAPRIKVKKITGTSPAIDGSLTYPHLVDAAKIIGVEIFVQYGASPVPTKVIPPGYTLTGNHHYQYEIDGANIRIQNVSGQSSQIGGKPLRIMITYEE